MIDVDNYRLVRGELSREEPKVYIEDGLHGRIEAIAPLGAGGCKRAYNCESSKRALLLPNMDADSLADIASYWENVVDCEVRMSKRLKRAGLLTLDLRKVSVYVPGLEEASRIVAYEAEHFQHLAERGIYVMDLKNSKSSTWHGKFFEEAEDRLNLQKWKEIVDPLSDDIAKLVVHGIQVPNDAVNLAIEETGDPHAPYQVRYLGFDFSGKGIGKMGIEEESMRPNLCQRVQRVANVCLGIGATVLGLDTAIDRIATNACWALFDEEYRTPESHVFGSEKPDEAIKTRDRLVRHIKMAAYRKIIAKMIGF